MIARLYDPLGILSPLIVRGKILMQQIWKESLDWDDVLTNSLLKKWKSFYKELLTVNQLKIPRWLGLFSGSKFEIHGFSDASEQAICAVIYFRVLGSGFSQSNLVLAKTKIAPLKTQSTPRLELCAALLLCKLVSSLLSAFDFSEIPIHLLQR